MHPIQDLFFRKFFICTTIDMHFYMHSYVDKNFILVKMGVTFPNPAYVHQLTDEYRQTHNGRPTTHIFIG
jgi:hypothetical protein